MNCEQVEDKIFLYEELSANDQNEVQQHLLTCVGCREVWAQRAQLKFTTQRWQSQEHTPEHAAQLTHQIMSALKDSRVKPEELTGLIDRINVAWVRFSLAAISCLLMLMFIIPADISAPANTFQRTPERRPVILNTNKFNITQREMQLSGKSKRTFSLARCAENMDCPPLMNYRKKISYEFN